MMTDLVVSDQVLRTTVDVVRSYSAWWRSREGVAYWLGTDDGITVRVAMVVAPVADTGPRHFRVSAEENARVIGLAHDHGLIVVGQIHSHPGSRTTHSAGDDEDAFMPSEGMYSLVVPYYARGAPPLASWGVHRFENGSYRRLTSRELDQRVHVAPLMTDLR